MNSSIRSLGAIVFGLLVALAAAAPAQAALSKTDQKCRDSVAKAFAKTVSSANKVSTGCHKSRNSGKIAAVIDCNNVFDPPTDSKGKFVKAQAKMESTVQKSCTDAGANIASFEDFISCPDPCGTTLGLPNPMQTFHQIGDCLKCLAGDVVNRRNAVQLGSPTPANLSKDEQKCAGAIAKGYGKHLSTLLKERQSCQKDQDATTNDLTFCSTADPKGKIGAAVTSAAAGVSDACGGTVNLADLDSCSNTDIASLNACLLAEDNARGGEAFSAGYELPATICPTRVDSTILAGNGISGTSRSVLDVGWEPLAHNSDLVDHYTLSSDVTCPASPPCGTCTVDGISANGPQYSAFLRCRDINLMDVPCTMPFQADPACGGSQCGYVLGPPLPLSSGGTPTCNVNFLANDISGTVNVDDGSGELTVNLKTFVLTSGTLVRPCPVCVGDTTPFDGQKDGHCSGTATPCDVEGFDKSFAPQSLNEGLSMDCRPTNNISGAGLIINLLLTTGHSQLAFENSCDAPLGSLDCACGVCNLNTSFPCRNNTECGNIGAGTCTSKGGGVSRRPNDCSDQTCTATNADATRGTCQSGNPSDTVAFCDGVTRSNGAGFVQCNTNDDCANSSCDDPDTVPVEDCGNCTLSTVKSCFLDPIVADGDPDVDNPLLVSTFCIPPTNNAGVNGAAGLPGPARVKTDMLTTKAFN